MSANPPPPDQFTRVSPSSAGTLHLQMPDGAARQFPMLASSLTIGRAPENDLVVEHVTVSRQHARLTLEQGRLYLEDLGSSNGSFLGEMRLTPGQVVEIPPDQVFELGQVKAVFHRFGTPAPASRPVSRPIAGLKSAGTALYNRLSPSVRVGLLLAASVVTLVFVMTCLIVTVSAIVSRRQTARLSAACDQVMMLPIFQGGNVFSPLGLATAFPDNPQLAQATPAPTQDSGIPEPLLTTAFLELPFPYDGGNENFGGTLEQFRLALQRNVGTGGRVNSFFDHYLPLYPAPKDPGSSGGKEPAEKPIAENIVPFDGLLNPYFSYSGHPALDFSTFVYRQPTTPIFAAADGVIAAVGTHGASGALYVKINHTVQGVGVFQTVYWHLHPDEFFDAMLGREGEPVSAGERIGTMGNTGFSTGHHLHFEVRFDQNNDGTFSGTEVVDPFGWIPSQEYSVDPWFERSGMVSNYLWVHPLGSAAQIPPDGGGQVAQPGGTGGEYPVSVCAQLGALPPGGTVLYSWAPDPDPSPAASGVGQGCVLSVLDAQGQPVTQFQSPVKIVLPFDQVDLNSVDPQSLTIYWQAPGADWQPLPTTLDFANQVAIAETDRPGKCSLMGLPTQDVLPPQTTIQISGSAAEDGSLYSQVTVTITSTDPSGVNEIYYSLDNGTTWLLYSEPFSLQPGPVPQPGVMDEEFFGGLPGTFVILASAIDTNGNVEDPPVMEYFSIDASKDPDQPTFTPTPSPTLSPTPTRTPTPTPTPTLTPTPTILVCNPKLTLTKNSNCRKGPGTVYDVFTSYFAGQELVLEGKNADGTWWVVQDPKLSSGSCWISAANVATTGDTACLPVIAAPPTPTPRPVDNTAPPAPSLLSPKDGSQLVCGRAVTLSWSAVDDASGIAEYQWVVEAMAFSTEQYSVVASGSTEGTSVSVSLEACTYYRWTVRAVDNAGNTGSYAPAFQFSLSEPG